MWGAQPVLAALSCFDLTNRRDHALHSVRQDTVKPCTCSIEQAKEAFSAWSEVELEQAINTLRKVLESKRSIRWRRAMPN